MPNSAWIAEIFPEPQQPYSMPEIINRLQAFYSPRITRSACYRALHRLEKSFVTAPMVVPLDADVRPVLYSAESARRIARSVTRGLDPDRLFPPKNPQPTRNRKNATDVKPLRDAGEKEAATIR